MEENTSLKQEKLIMKTQNDELTAQLRKNFTDLNEKIGKLQMENKTLANDKQKLTQKNDRNKNNCV